MRKTNIQFYSAVQKSISIQFLLFVVKNRLPFQINRTVYTYIGNVRDLVTHTHACMYNFTLQLPCKLIKKFTAKIDISL